jgi:hypothetical protein
MYVWGFFRKGIFFADVVVVAVVVVVVVVVAAAVRIVRGFHDRPY